MVLVLGLGPWGSPALGRVPISTSHASVIHHPKAVRSTFGPEELILCAHHREPAGSQGQGKVSTCRHLQLQSKTFAAAYRLRETGTFVSTQVPEMDLDRYGPASVFVPSPTTRRAADRLLFPDE